MTQILSDILRTSDVKHPPLLNLVGKDELAIKGFPVFDLEDAISLWQKLLSLSEETRCSPVFLGGDENIEYLQVLLSNDSIDYVEKDIQKTKSFLLTEWLERRSLALLRDQFDFHSRPDQCIEFSDNPTRGFDPEKNYLGLVPIRENYLTPAFVGFGGWNDFPPTYVHLALIQRWNRVLDADIISITRDSISLRIKSPPLDSNLVRGIREELFFLCPSYPEHNIPKITDCFPELSKANYWCLKWHYPWPNDIYPASPLEGI